MDKKTTGKICALICMVSVAIYFICGMIAHSYQNAWIVFIVAGIACAGVSMFAGNKKGKSGDGSEKDGAEDAPVDDSGTDAEE